MAQKDRMTEDGKTYEDEVRGLLRKLLLERMKCEDCPCSELPDPPETCEDCYDIAVNGKTCNLCAESRFEVKANRPKCEHARDIDRLFNLVEFFFATVVAKEQSIEELEAQVKASDVRPFRKTLAKLVADNATDPSHDYCRCHSPKCGECAKSGDGEHCRRSGILREAFALLGTDNVEKLEAIANG